MNFKHLLIFTICLVSTVTFAQKDIFDVARSGTIDDVKQLMVINKDTINIANSKGYLPLTLACYNGNTKVALFLANHVNDIDGNSTYGTPLMAAVFQNKTEIAKGLLELKANPNNVDANGTSALHYAVIKRNEAIIKLLVDANADTSLKDNREKTAMDYAVMTKNKNIIELLSKK